MSDLFLYIKMSIKTLLKYPSFKTISDCFRYYSNWKKHLPGRPASGENTLWITFGATEFLKQISHKDMQLFEYGSGGSTMFWSGRVKHVVSVEHDKAWYEKMKKEFRELKIDNVDYFFIQPETDPHFPKKNYQIPADYISSDQNYTGKNFEKYVKVIDKYPDAFFDIIVVDGRARPSCIDHSLSKLKTGGFLVVDNSERAYYLSPFKFDKQSWKIWKFAGPVPYMKGFSETTILKKIQ